MTLREAAQAALDVQDAVNLSGVVFTFAQVMQTLCEAFYDTEVRNTHPIVTVFLDKLVQLNRSGYILSQFEDSGTLTGEKTFAAYRAVREFAETGNLPEFFR